MALLLLLMSIISTSAQTINKDSVVSEKFNWNYVIDAIAKVESGGNPKAVSSNGLYVGLLQISTGCVKQCNIILSRKGSKKRFTNNDRYNAEKSKEMFVIMQNEYNPECNIEKAIRMWNGGPKYKIASTNGYYRKVMRHYLAKTENK